MDPIEENGIRRFIHLIWDKGVVVWMMDWLAGVHYLITSIKVDFIKHLSVGQVVKEVDERLTD